jgi:hypothetical protein
LDKSGQSYQVVVLKLFAKRHGVIVNPGGASGGPGYVCVLFGNAFGNTIQDVKMVKVIIYFSFWGYWAICKMPR